MQKSVQRFTRIQMEELTLRCNLANVFDGSSSSSPAARSTASITRSSLLIQQENLTAIAPVQTAYMPSAALPDVQSRAFAGGGDAAPGGRSVHIRGENEPHYC